METQTTEIDWAWDHPVVQDLLVAYYREWLFSTPETADQAVERILALTGLKPPGHVVDIGCGLGYHAVAFARRGFHVMAFDPGDKYLSRAQQHVTRTAVHVDIRHMPCAELAEIERFDLAWAGAYCPGQLSPAEVGRDFSLIRQALVRGGWFVGTVAGKPKVPPSSKVRNWGELRDCFVLSEKWADDTFYHEHCWFVYPGENRVIKLIEVERMYGVREVVPLLEKAGFAEIQTADSLSAAVPAREGKHFAFWCRRPQA